MTQDYAILGALVIVGTVSVAITLMASSVLSDKRSSSVEKSTYECGVASIDTPWVRLRISYFIYALLLVVFDIAVAFLFLWAVVIQRMSAFVLVQMAVFAGILLLGLVYACKEEALTWR